MTSFATTLDLNKVNEIINGFDFSYVLARAAKEGMPEAVAPIALEQLKAFLFQCAAHPEMDLVPQSKACDDLWHAFIVADTHAYVRFCDAVYGGYLHHDGVDTAGERMAEARKSSDALFGKTIAMGVDCMRVADCMRAGVPAVSHSAMMQDLVSANADCMRAADCMRKGSKAGVPNMPERIAA